MELEGLKKKIPYKWRVQSFSKFKPEATCVAYVDSRDVQDLLDEVVGAENWQCSYDEHKDNLFCGIGIKCGDDWVWKWDCGTESNVDKEKGEASDAFKRAAVKWGAGRFLYALKIVRLPANEKKASNNYPHVVDSRGARVWDITEHINKTQGERKSQKPAEKKPQSSKDLYKKAVDDFTAWVADADKEISEEEMDIIRSAWKTPYKLIQLHSEYSARFNKADSFKKPNMEG